MTLFRVRRALLLRVPCDNVLHGFHTAEDQAVAVFPVIEGPVDPADGGGGSPGLFCDLQIGIAVPEHGGHLEPLGNGQKLVDRAQVLKKGKALFLGLQCKYSLKKMSDRVSSDFLVHALFSPLMC